MTKFHCSMRHQRLNRVKIVAHGLAAVVAVEVVVVFVVVMVVVDPDMPVVMVVVVDQKAVLKHLCYCL